jgi:hypothetical protein
MVASCEKMVKLYYIVVDTQILSKGEYMASYKKWTDAELQFIRDNLNSLADKDLANKLSGMTGENISQAMIRRQRRKLGVNKPRGRPRKVVAISANDQSSTVG